DRILGAQGGLQVVEAGIPELAGALHPLRELVERLRIEREKVVAPGDAPPHQTRALEEPGVLRDRVERDFERRRDLGHARLAGSEVLEDRAAGSVRQGNQGVVQLHACIFTQKGEYVKAPVSSPFYPREARGGPSAWRGALRAGNR